MADKDIEARMRIRSDNYTALRGSTEVELKGGRWINISDYRTQDGGTVSVHNDITAQRSAEKSAIRRNELVQMLRDIAIEINEAASVEDAMHNCLSKVCNASDFCIGHAYILNDSGQEELAPTRIWHLDNESQFSEFVQATENKPFNLGIGLPGRVWASGKPHWIEDVRVDSNFPRANAAKLDGIVSGCAFPVMERDKTVAVLEFFSQKRLKQDNVLLDAFTSLSNLLGRVTERKRTMGTLHRLQQAIEQSPSMIIITDNEGCIEYVNPEFTIKTGYRPEQILGQTPGILKSDETPASVHDHLWATIKNGNDWRGELLNKTKSGGTYWSSLAISPIRNDRGEITHFLGISEDISERKSAEQHIKHLAHFDNLTDLPNRAMFYSDSQRILASAKRSESSAALLMLDLDDFKDVNDSLGHAAGDQLLKEVGDRLLDCMRDYDVVARLGGDEFATILPDIADPDSAADTAKRLIEVIREPYNIENTDLYINASIGVAIYPQDGTDTETLLRHADLAMYRAKARGRGTFNFFHESMDNEVQARKDIEADLRVAMSENQLDLAYQPQVDTQSKEIIGVEALVRWHHPERGMVPPYEFIPIAERSGLIVPIGEWVLRKACNQAMKWAAKGYSELSMSVNLSPIQFKHHELLPSIERVLEDTGIPPHLLTLEITESVVVQETDDNVRLLSQLQDRGIMIALDDFGTGYSSLSYLTQLPLNKIKIDRSFIVGMMQSKTQRSVVQTIVELGNALGKSITVEGVEDCDQYEYLKSINVDEIQGYYFSKPLRPDELEELIKPKK